MANPPRIRGRAAVDHIGRLQTADDTVPAHDDQEILDAEDAPHAVFDGPLWQQVVAASRRRARPLTAAQRRIDIPDFDDPDFMAKLHTDAAPIDDRVRLFIRLWRSFDPALRAEFLADLGVRGAG